MRDPGLLTRKLGHINTWSNEVFINDHANRRRKERNRYSQKTSAYTVSC